MLLTPYTVVKSWNTWKKLWLITLSALLTKSIVGAGRDWLVPLVQTVLLVFTCSLGD